MSLAAGISAIQQSAAASKPFIEGFLTARTVANDTLKEWWNGATVASIKAAIDKDGYFYSAAATAGDVPYFVAGGIANVKKMSVLNIGAANSVLVSTGSAPSWATTLAGLTLTSPTITGTGAAAFSTLATSGLLSANAGLTVASGQTLTLTGVTVTGLSANLTGNVTGNCSGTAATVTGATQASITTCANLTTVGALAAGSIVAGFGGAVFGGEVSIPANLLTFGTAWTGYEPSSTATLGVKLRHANRGFWLTELGFINLVVAGYANFGVGRVNGTTAAPTAVVTGDLLGTFNFRGYDTVNVGTGAAAIACYAAEDFSASPARHASTIIFGAYKKAGSGYSRWTMDSEGGFTPGSDAYPNTNAQDLGSAAAMWRTGYFGTSVVAPTLVLGAATVTYGANDSGGAGYKVLRVPN